MPASITFSRKCRPLVECEVKYLPLRNVECIVKGVARVIYVHQLDGF